MMNEQPISQTLQSPLPTQPILQTSLQTPATPVKSKNRLVLLLAIITLLSLGAASFFGYKYWQSQLQPITTYEECVKANGNQITLMFPGTCTTRDGRQFTEPLTDEEKKKLELPDPTASWKTYTNNKYQFSFKYPNNLVLLDPIGYEHAGYKNSTDYQNSLGKTAAITDRLFEFNIDSFPKDTYPDKAKLTFDELIEDAVRGHCGGDGVESSFRCDKLLTSESFVTNNGAQGKKFAYTIITTNSMKKSITQQQTGSLYAFNLSDATTSRIILFHTPNFFPPNSEDQKVFDQILSTFKFVNQESNVDISSWKSYSFPIVGLTFKAPANLSVELTETKNTNTGTSVGYTLYIQNNSTDIKKFYQLYGIYQNPPNYNYSEKDLEEHKQDLITDSITSITIDGHIGIRGQISGQRNRYVTHLLINNGLLSLFTAEPTMDNEKLSNQIIDTFKFTK